MRYAANPRAFTLKQWFAQLLNVRNDTHDNIIERVALSLVTDKDMEDFGKLLMAVYEAGYHKAVSDYKKEFEKMGVVVSVVKPEDQSPKSGFTSEATAE